MNVQELIHEDIKYLRDKIDVIGSDVAVLKSQHNTGNRSEKVAALMSVFAVLVSVLVAIFACNGCKKEIRDEEPKKIDKSGTLDITDGVHNKLRK